MPTVVVHIRGCRTQHELPSSRPNGFPRPTEKKDSCFSFSRFFFPGEYIPDISYQVRSITVAPYTWAQNGRKEASRCICEGHNYAASVARKPIINRE